MPFKYLPILRTKINLDEFYLGTLLSNLRTQTPDLWAEYRATFVECCRRSWGGTQWRRAGLRSRARSSRPRPGADRTRSWWGRTAWHTARRCSWCRTYSVAWYGGWRRFMFFMNRGWANNCDIPSVSTSCCPFTFNGIGMEYSVVCHS